MFRQRNLRDLFGVGFTAWEYQTEDSIAEVMSPGYFDLANPTRLMGSAEQLQMNLKPGDMIFALVAEGNQILTVDEADKHGVVVSQYRTFKLPKRRADDIAITEE